VRFVCDGDGSDDLDGLAGPPGSAQNQARDTITNPSTAAVNELGDAVAHSVDTLARFKSGVFEDGSRMAKGRS
jgi:hypothetical protein